MSSHSHASAIRRTGTVVSWLRRAPHLLNTQFSCKAIHSDESLKSTDSSSKTPCFSGWLINLTILPCLFFLCCRVPTSHLPISVLYVTYLKLLCKRQFLRLISTGGARFIAEAANGNTQLKYQRESILPSLELIMNLDSRLSFLEQVGAMVLPPTPEF